MKSKKIKYVKKVVKVKSKSKKSMMLPSSVSRGKSFVNFKPEINYGSMQADQYLSLGKVNGNRESSVNVSPRNDKNKLMIPNSKQSEKKINRRNSNASSKRGSIAI